MKTIGIIGAGWAGATTARLLADIGIDVVVYESSRVTGGHSRSEFLNGVLYEPNGAHIFHTSNNYVYDFVSKYGLKRPYEHKVVSAVRLGGEKEFTYLSWPPQINELKKLKEWVKIEPEINTLPESPAGNDFESFVISMMGHTLYEMFIRDYTIKQWGRSPKELSSSFAPKRVELRRDGYKRLFRDTWEFYPPNGINEIIDNILSGIPIIAGTKISAADLQHLETQHSVIIMTGALDDFLNETGRLEWRGIGMKSKYYSSDRDEKITPSYVVNHPTLEIPYTRTVESKHASGQKVLGSVVSEEYPGTSDRHYPVPTVDGENEKLNNLYKAEIKSLTSMPVLFCGRLANYEYINQDQAILQGFECVKSIVSTLN